MTCIIYSLNCPITGEPKYVGQTTSPKKRFSDHLRSKRNSPKYGWIKSLIDSGLLPVMEIIIECDREELNFWEIHYVSLYKSWGFELKNLTGGGNSNIVSHETRVKIREAKLGTKASVETRAKMSVAGKGRVFTEEHKRKISEAHKAKLFTEERRAKLKKVIDSNIGRKQTISHIEKRVKKNTGQKRTEETKLKQSLAAIGKPKSEETKKKISLALSLRASAGGVFIKTKDLVK